MTDVTPLIPKDRMVIDSYRPGAVRIAGQLHERSVLVFPRQVRGWPPATFEDIDAAALAPFADPPEPVDVLLIGCGAKNRFLPPTLRAQLRDHGIVADAMDTGAACRTYNVLLAEGRAVAAALIMVPGPNP